VSLCVCFCAYVLIFSSSLSFLLCGVWLWSGHELFVPLQQHPTAVETPHLKVGRGIYMYVYIYIYIQIYIYIIL
jgi:hypothetical protein